MDLPETLPAWALWWAIYTAATALALHKKDQKKLTLATAVAAAPALYTATLWYATYPLAMLLQLAIWDHLPPEQTIRTAATAAIEISAFLLAAAATGLATHAITRSGPLRNILANTAAAVLSTTTTLIATNHLPKPYGD